MAVPYGALVNRFGRKSCFLMVDVQDVAKRDSDGICLLVSPYIICRMCSVND